MPSSPKPSNMPAWRHPIRPPDRPGGRGPRQCL
jgi:hypothetical protein